MKKATTLLETSKAAALIWVDDECAAAALHGHTTVQLNVGSWGTSMTSYVIDKLREKGFSVKLSRAFYRDVSISLLDISWEEKADVNDEKPT